MSKEKQIEEITNELIFTSNYGNLALIAKHLYEKGYRKQHIKQSEWISVDERLPDKGTWCLVNIINHFGLDFVTFTHYTKGYGWAIPDVTHWMPLPEAPKMKGGAE